MTTLSLVNLTKKYEPGITAVTDLNLTLHQGELMVLLGPSGCGKTTTLRLIAGLLTPTAGDILFDGRSMLTIPPEKRGAVMVFQKDALFSFMSVGENVAFGLKVQKLDRAEIEARVAAALTAVQLPNTQNRRPDQLSGGQRQRVALARALVVQPRLLLLDEPLSNIDPELREELRQMIRSLQQETDITMLFVTHDQAEAVTLADQIGLMINGRIRQISPPRDFYEKPVDAQVARFFGATNFIPGIKQGHVVKTEMGQVEVLGTAVADGPVTLTIRPEAIEIGANGHNNFLAKIHTNRFYGQSSQCQVFIKDTQLQISTHPFNAYQSGQEIVLHLPRERICLLPTEGST